MIDEVEEVVHIDWILPRFLNANHMEIMVSSYTGHWYVLDEEIDWLGTEVGQCDQCLCGLTSKEQFMKCR